MLYFDSSVNKTDFQKSIPLLRCFFANSKRSFWLFSLIRGFLRGILQWFPSLLSVLVIVRGWTIIWDLSASSWAKSVACTLGFRLAVLRINETSLQLSFFGRPLRGLLSMQLDDLKLLNIVCTVDLFNFNNYDISPNDLLLFL